MFAIKKTGFILTIMFLCAVKVGVALEDTEEKLIDVIIFKESVTLPVYISERELKCFILEETPSTFRVDISHIKSIQDIKEISKDLVKTANRGNRSGVEFSKIQDALTLPKDSHDLSYYEALEKDLLTPFLNKYSKGEGVEEVKEFDRQVQREMHLVKAGWIRYGTEWYNADQAAKAAKRKDLDTFLKELSTLQEKIWVGNYDGLVGLAPKLEKHKNKPYYPELIEGVEAIVKPAGSTAPRALWETLNKVTSVYRDAAHKFESADQAIREIQTKNIQDPEIITVPLEDLIRVARTWPDLEALLELCRSSMDLFVERLWLIGIGGDPKDNRPVKTTMGLLQSLIEYTNLNLEEKVNAQNKIKEAGDFLEALQRNSMTKKLEAIVEMRLPAGQSPLVEKKFAERIAEAQKNINESTQALRRSRKAYEEKDYLTAKSEIETARNFWPNNPECDAFREELLTYADHLIEARKRETAENIVGLLEAGWIEEPSVRSARQSLDYAKSSLFTLDNMSYVIIGLIVLIGVIGFFSLRSLGKLFSE